ncbi:ATP-grasp domain-containing protein [Olsenella massiliensis]|uniref:ATP-grasp domain-containing protein n=1 Tax=Olsenella massiliensis TaxID=1622075 RepID=UPI00071D7007|nr:ATP-grasp domain-containing protein [Olsenella massiliensis]
MRRLAIIGAGPMACVFAQRARELGIETHCFAWAQGAQARDAVDVFHDVSVTEHHRIARICRDLGIDGVVATTELTIHPAAAVAHALGLNGHDVEVARVLTDKHRNREAVRDVEGLCQPRHRLVKADEPADMGSWGLSYPAIVKPTSEGGKRGVTVVTDDASLAGALAYARQEKKASSDIIVEELVPEGQEYSVESLSYHGEHRVIQVTEKWSSGAPHCVELGHHQPARLSAAQRSRVEDVLARALSAVGVSNGCCHTEVKLCGDDLYLIEFNARPGGDHISHPLTELSTGYPYVTGMIQIALDDFELPDASSFEANAAGICFVTEQTKELRDVFDRCQDEPWCYERHEVPGGLRSLEHNHVYDTNYFIYFSREGRPAFLDDVERHAWWREAAGA